MHTSPSTNSIALVSGHPTNWHAGASTVFLHLQAALADATGRDITLFHADDYAPRRVHPHLHKFVMAFALDRLLTDRLAGADVVEIAGNCGWRAFRRLRARRARVGRRPLLVSRLHGLEFLDEQVRVAEEIARCQRLPMKYKAVTRHWTNWQERESLAAADLVVCHSSRDADAVVAAGWKDARQVTVMPLGVDPSFAGPRDYSERGSRLLWWGSWIDRKGVTAVPRAFAMACAERPDLTLTIGGAGRSAAEVLGAFPAEVRDRVSVLPFVSADEHRRVLLDHNIMLFPSLSEGFGLAMLEAMAGGMPVITTFTGLAHDWLEHGVNCVLVPMSAPTPLSRAIVALAGDRHRRERIGTGARATAARLTWADLGRNTLAAYAEHADRHRADLGPAAGVT